MLISNQEKRNIYNAISEIKKCVYRLEEAKHDLMTRIRNLEDRLDIIEKVIDTFYNDKYDVMPRVRHSEDRLDEIENVLSRLERGMK